MQALLETGLSNALMASLLALFAFACSRWARPALVHGLWLLVLLKLLTPALIPISLPWPAVEEPAMPEALPPAPIELTDRHEALGVDPAALDEAIILALARDSEPPKLDRVTAPIDVGDVESSGPEVAIPGWREILVPLWLGGTGLWLAWTAGSVWRFQRVLRSARLAPADLQDQARVLAAQLGLRRCPRVYLVGGAVSPMIWAVGTVPRLLFPSRLLGCLDREQRAALLLHELAHIRRRDHWVRLVELLAVSLYWWNPVVWWARRELREAEEQCCDAWVVWASSGASHAYATALLQAVAFVSRVPSPLPVGASGLGQVSHLRRRLVMIMRGNTPKSLSATGWLVLLGLALFLLPVVPAQAQAPRDDKRDQEIKALKDRLRSLEEERAAQRAKAEFTGQKPKEPPAEVQEVLRAAAELKGQIAKKRAELQDLEAKLNHLLQKVEGYKDLKGSKLENLKHNLDAEKLKFDAVVRDKEAIIKAYKQQADEQQRAANEALKQAKDALARDKVDLIKQYKKQAEEQQLRATDALKQAKEHLLLEQKKAADLEKHYKETLNAQKLDKAKAIEAYEAVYANKVKKDIKSASLEERLERIMKEVAELRQEMLNMQRQQKLAPEKKE
jgi:beta-lactamase regulating signal transducer with metallopeptidase domain